MFYPFFGTDESHGERFEQRAKANSFPLQTINEVTNQNGHNTEGREKKLQNMN